MQSKQIAFIFRYVEYCRAALCKCDIMGPAVIILGDMLPPGAEVAPDSIQKYSQPYLEKYIPGENLWTYGENMLTGPKNLDMSVQRDIKILTGKMLKRCSTV